MPTMPQFDSQQMIGGKPAWRFIGAGGQPVLVTDPLQAQRLGAPVGRPPMAGPPPGAPAAVQALARPPAAGPDMRTAQAAPASNDDIMARVNQGMRGGVDPGAVNAQATRIATDATSQHRAPIDTSAAGVGIPAGAAAGQTGQAPAAPTGPGQAQLDKARELREYTASLAPKARYVAPVAAGFVNDTRQVEGPDPAVLDKLRADVTDLRDKRIAAAKSKADEEVALNEARSAALEEVYWDKKVKASDLEDEHTQKRSAYETQMKKFADERQAAAKDTVNQDQWFEKRPGSKWLAAILIGVGEFARGLRKDSVNGAADIIKASIDDDISSQKAKLAANKDALSQRENAYARRLADGEDPKLAEAKLRAMQSEIAATELERSSLTMKSIAAQQLARETALEIRQRALQDETAIAAMEKVKINERYQQGRAGGVVGPTMKEVSEHSEYEKKFLGNKSDTLGIDPTLNPETQGEVNKAGGVAKAQAEAKGEIAGKSGLTATAAGHAQDELKKGQDLLATYVRAIKEAGGDVNLETGEITGDFDPPIDFSIPDWVPIIGGINPDTEATAKFKSDTAASANTYANMTNNWAEAGQPTKELFKITGAPIENTTAKVQSQVADVVARVNATKEILGTKKPKVEIKEKDATR